MTEIILGPPGTGKTTTLLRVVESELKAGTPPERIGYVSFTRRAAEEAVSRASDQFALDRARFPNFRTLHSLCFRRLGLKSSDIMEGKRLQDFAEYAGVRVTGRWSDDGTLSGFDKGDRILFMENLARIRCITLREQYDVDDDDLSWTEVQRVARALAQYKEREGLMDFTDLLVEFVRSGQRPELDVLIVDESQDVSKLQWRMVEYLSEGCRRVLVGGDDDQAIYEWAGADAEYLVNLPGDVRVLDRSYRVPPRIKEIAMSPLSRVRHRREKRWRAKAGGDGVVDRERGFQNVDCDGKDVLVLARNAFVLKDQVEPELRRRGVLYEKNGHPSIRPAYLEAIRCWESLRSGRRVSVEQARNAYDFLTSGSGVKRGYKELRQLGDRDEVSIVELQEAGGLLTTAVWHEALTRIPQSETSYLLSALRRGERTRERPRVRVSTIHGSKGGEADHVVLMKEMAWRTHREMLDGGEEAEARVWYVGSTRAKERLTIVESRTKLRCPWL